MPGIFLTEKAINEVKRIMGENGFNPDHTYFRARVLGGGCSGYTTKLDLDEAYTDKDEMLEQDGVKIVVDCRSILYLNGSTVDFVDDSLDKRGFVVNNPNASSKCGCGSSFSM